MSVDIVIRAEGLGKKYVIGHETERERYTALRDVLGRRAKTLFRTTSDMLGGRPIVAGDTTEEIWALDDINFEVRRGEVLGIIGRNGAGKSTLLKILSRITEPTVGQVEIRGRVSSLLEVGTGFHPELTGRENIYLNGAILGMMRAEVRRKFDEIVAFAEVEKFLDTPVKRYSSGMYVRLAFAVAAHLEPQILMVDEVLTVGDAQFQKRCLGRMREVAGGGRTVLFVSHNMGAVANLCSRCILLKEGKIFKDGPSSEAISEYMEARPPPNEMRPNTGGKEAALIGGELTGQDIQGNSVLWSKDFALTLYYRAVQIQDLELSFAVLDRHGRQVFVSSLKHRCTDSSNAESYVATAKIPGRFLAPGTYYVSVALHRPNICMYDNVNDMLLFTIIGDNPEHYRFLSGDGDYGVVTIDIDWTLERHEPSRRADLAEPLQSENSPRMPAK
jgi:lipopolysaccharide transport system ATP-binding protein